jgi:hypothetical protein
LYIIFAWTAAVLLMFICEVMTLTNLVRRYEKAIVAMAKQSVTLEVLSYHASASLEEAIRLKVREQITAAY